MSLRKKLLLYFGIVIFITILFSGHNFLLQNEFHDDVENYATLTNLKQLSSTTKLNIINIWQFITDASLTGDEEVLTQNAEKCRVNAFTAIDDWMLEDTKNKAELETLKKEINEYLVVGKNMFDGYQRSKSEGNVQMEIFDASSEALLNSIVKLDDSLNERCAGSVGEMKEMTESAKIITIILAVAIFLIGIIVALVAANKIIKPIKNLTSNAEEISKGNMEVQVNSNSDDEIGDLEKSFGVMVQNIKEQSEAVNHVANGNLEITLKPKSEKDVLSNGINSVIHILKGLVIDLKSLTTSASNGELQARVDKSKYRGSYSEIINGVNNTLDAFVQPLNEAGKVLERMSKGEISEKMVGEYQGDFYKLKNSIDVLSESLTHAMLEVTDAVKATASASNEISSSTEQMAAGAQEQSAQASEVAAAVEQMTKTIMETSKNSSAASEASKNAGKIAKEGGDRVKETIMGMNEIADTVKQSSEKVRLLGQSSEQIGEIVQVIDDIADQTNLLALNAAIEAARAGEQGRGFAVVADEVRKLAERTTKATKEIALMIKQIQQDTSAAVDAMELGSKKADNGKLLANKAGESLEQIIRGSENVVDIISQVAAASEEQSSAAEQISKNIESINAVTQESAQGVQQIASAAEDLNRLTQNLEALTSRFKISDSHTHSNSLRSRTSVRHNGSILVEEF